jgi:hypothetical protein
MEALARHAPEFAVAAALAWGAGLRVYATLFCVGLAGLLGWVDCHRSCTCSNRRSSSVQAAS